MSDEETKHDPVYVVNPTTNQFRALSSPSVMEDMDDGIVVRYALAFNPSKSPHYKVVCVTNLSDDYYDEGQHLIDIYSSESGEWKHLEALYFPSPQDGGRHFDYRSREGAVYCNGIVHWIRNRMEVVLSWGRTKTSDGPWSRDEWKKDECDVVHYFDIGEERFRLAPVAPPVALSVRNISLEDFPTSWPSLAQRYFVECRGRLYLIEIFEHCKTRFEVMEMERNYSGWFAKYHVDLNPLVAALPGLDWNALAVLGLYQEDETDNGVEDTSTHLLLQLPGKIISYNLRDETFKTSVELGNKELFQALGDYDHIQEDVDYHHTQEDVTFPYMETLTCV